MGLRLKLGAVVVGLIMLLHVGYGVAQSAIATPMDLPETVIAECGVYPQTFHESYLDAKIPLASADRDRPANELLQATYARSQIKVFQDSWTSFGFLSWTNASISTSELDAAYSDRGLLGHGFSEATPPPMDSVANGQINQRLEIGDWIRTASANIRPSPSVLDTHIAGKRSCSYHSITVVQGVGIIERIVIIACLRCACLLMISIVLTLR